MRHITTDELRQMTGTEGLILQGCGGDPQEWLSGVNETLTQEGILLDGAAFKETYVFEHDGLTNILFSMEDVKLDIGKLAMWRLASYDTFGGTWLSDYLPNRLGIETDEPDIVQPPAPSVGADPALTEATPASGQSPIMQVYIENAGDGRVGGFTIPLPTTAEKLRPWLEAIEVSDSGQGIAITDVRSDLPGLGAAILSCADNGLNLEELNFLAVKVSELREDDRNIMSAVLEAERHCGNVAELINLTGNLDRFHLQPAFSEEQYGEFLLDMVKADTSDVFSKLEQSGYDDERNLAKHILRLEAHVDYAAYGRTAAEEKGGVFTKQGYLTEREGFQTIYRGPEDIPKESRLFDASQVPFLKAKNIDLSAFVAKVHALCGDYLSDAAHNLSTLEARRSAEYLMFMGEGHVVLTEASHAYRYESDQFHDFTISTEFMNAKAFALHVTDVHQPHLMGDAVEMDVQALREDILRHCIYPTHIDAVQKSGQEVSFTPEQWNGLETIDRDQIESWTRRFEPGAYSAVQRHLEDVREKHEQSGKAIAPEELLVMMNAAYMESSKNPQPTMLRIPLVAARDMLANSDAAVFRLLPEGAKQLSPLDAMQSRGGLWYQQHREFAIRKEDAPGLDRWANRVIEAAVKPAPERDTEKSNAREER